MREYFSEGPVERASQVLGVEHATALRCLEAFEAAGYLRRSEEDSLQGAWWETTIRGNALAQASFGKPIKRATADRHLAQVVERARVYNADPARLLTVGRIAIFGSYLDPNVERLGDLDLAVSVVRRDSDGQRHVDNVLAYARASGRRFGTFHEQLFWPRRELFMILKNRSPAIVLLVKTLTSLRTASRSLTTSPRTLRRYSHRLTR
ncbi:hypothetical protein [Actinomadura nitritigenes]|uniref:hypothetical protein n=1 Tax=Actinomadura nitritigenes TaxID=134602 RepID=UPI003D93D992